MAYRVLARFEDQRIRSTLQDGRNLIGSDASCEICLPNPTVSRRHAALTVHNGSVELEDLGSTNGTLLRSQRIDREAVEPGDIFVIGRVVVLLEKVSDDDLEVGIRVKESNLDRTAAGLEVAETLDITQSFTPLDSFTLDHLPRLLEQLCSDCDRHLLAQKVGYALFETMPVKSVEIVETSVDSERGMLYHAEELRFKQEEARAMSSTVGNCQVRVSFINERAAQLYRPVVDSAALLLALAERDRAPMSPPPKSPSPPERPQPPSVEPAVQEIYNQAERVARGDVGVMIFGESGTGKEVLAGFLHAASPRAQKPLVAINCASLPRDLLEAELFGVEKGVATGVEARPGKFEAANEGTLFLDEIGDMAPETQAKILRVLQGREVYRIGGHTPRSADIRIIAATNRPLQTMISEGTFRNDLYHRIATWEVELPPLRHRRGDIPNLAAYFLHEEAQRYGIRPRGVSRAALRMLRRYHWPGNIRQLRNEISRAVLFLEDRELLDTARLSPAIRGEQEDQLGKGLTEVLEAVERDEILAALESCSGDTNAAAEMLKISRPTLYRRLKNLRIEVPTAATAM